MRYVIPTYQRYMRQPTVDLLIESAIPPENITLIVNDESEKRAYRDALKLENIHDIQIKCSNSKGIVGARNYVFEHIEQPFVMLDDDIEKLLGLKNKHFKDISMYFPEAMREAFAHCEKHNAVMFGLSPYRNGRYASIRPPIDINKYFMGWVMGVNGFKCKVPDDIEIGEDIYAELMAMKEGKTILRLNEFTVKTKPLAKGGCSESRERLGIESNNSDEIIRKIYNSFNRKLIVQFGNRRLMSANKDKLYKYKE